MSWNTVLTTARLELAPVRLADAAETAQLMTPSISRMLTTWPERMSIAQAVRRIEVSLAERRETLWADWAMRLETSRDLIGWVGVGRKKISDTRLTIGIWIGEAYQGQGLGGEAVAAIVQFASVCATAIRAQVDMNNERSIRTFKRLGFELIDEINMYSNVRESYSKYLVFELRFHEPNHERGMSFESEVRRT